MPNDRCSLLNRTDGARIMPLHRRVTFCTLFLAPLLLLLVGLHPLAAASTSVESDLSDEAYAKGAALQAALDRYPGGWAGLDLASQSQWDARHYSLDLAVTLGLNYPSISGTASTRARSLVYGLDRVELNMWDYDEIPGTLEVDAVKVNGVSASYSHYDDVLTVFLSPPRNPGTDFTVSVTYHGQPREQIISNYKVGLILDRRGLALTPVVYSNSWPYYARSWWPCKDVPGDKAEDGVDVRITHPSSYVCVANGAYPPQIVNNGNGTKTTTWHHYYSIPAYLVCFAFTNYGRYDNVHDGIPVVSYYYPENQADVNAIWRTLIPPSIGTYESLFGPYPFEKYGMHHIGKSVWPYVWSMEHQTMSSIAVNDTRDRVTLVHELAHQWWGDWVTPVGWRHLWLSEGFASYAEALLEEAQMAPDSLFTHMDGKRNGAFNFTGTILLSDSTNAINMLAGMYTKPAWVLHMARYWTRYADWLAHHTESDAAFFNVIRTFGSQHAYGTAATGSLVSLFASTVDTRMTDFFTRWLQGTGYPVYRFSVRVQGPDDIDLRVRQVQGSPYFAMPLRVLIYPGRDTAPYVTWVYNDAMYEEIIPVHLDNVGEAPDVEFDVDGWVLQKHSYIPWTQEGDVTARGTNLRAEKQLPALSATPNPVRTSVEITYANPGMTSTRLSIYDAAGRRVRSLEAAGSNGIVVWDGTNEIGERVVPGVYFVRLDGRPAMTGVRIIRIE